MVILKWLGSKGGNSYVDQVRKSGNSKGALVYTKTTLNINFMWFYKFGN